LFVAMLAFDEAARVNAAKVGILGGSLLAAVVAAIILKCPTRKLHHGLPTDYTDRTDKKTQP
jgi:Na+/H+ antiporter NhaA